MDAVAHYTEAERLLAEGERMMDGLYVASALVHATLATAAAMILTAARPGSDFPKLFGEDGNEDA